MMSSGLNITVSGYLTEAESAIEKRFAEFLNAELDENIIRYLVEFGRVVDTDRAREFCQDYRKSDEARTRWSRATYAPAKALSDEVFHRVLGGFAFFPRQRDVLFTSGGSGSGKTTVLQAFKTPFDLLVDGTLTDYAAAKQKLSATLRLGCTATVLHVYVEFSEAVRRVINRALEIGRAVTVDNLAATHFRARETFVRLAKALADRVNFLVLESGFEINPQELTLEELERRCDKSLDEMRQEAHDLVRNEFGNLRNTHPEIFSALLQKGRF